MKMNYFWLQDITYSRLPMNFKHQYKSFLILFEQLYYPKAFYFNNIKSMIIRTTDSRQQVIDNIIHLKANYWDVKEVPMIYFILFKCVNHEFIHPFSEEEEWVSGEKLYEVCALKYFEDTGIDLLQDEINIVESKSE
jgi:hypothetical protein